MCTKFWLVFSELGKLIGCCGVSLVIGSAEFYMCMELRFGQLNQIPHRYWHEHDRVTAIIHLSDIFNCLKLTTLADICSCQYVISTAWCLAVRIL
jgi:hypothetical protein